MKKVSVLVPVYNVSAYLERFLGSLWAQTFKDVEYIFMDDCSTDNSYSLLSDEISKVDFDCKLLQHEKNRGLAQTRDDLLRAATGEFVTCIDSDDWLEPDYLEKLVAASDGYDIVQCGYFEELKDKQIVHKGWAIPEYDKLLHDSIAVKLESFVWFKLIRRSLINDYHWKPGANQGEDYLTTLWLYAHTTKINSIPDPLYHYNCQNMTSITKTNTYKNFVILFDEAEQLMLREGLLPKYEDAFNQRVFMFKKDLILRKDPNWEIFRTYRPNVNYIYERVRMGKLDKMIFKQLSKNNILIAKFLHLLKK